MNLLFLLMTLGNPFQQPLSKTTGAVVIVEDHQLHIPPLPRNRMDARWHYNEARREIAVTTKVLEGWMSTLGKPITIDNDNSGAVPDQNTEICDLNARLSNDPFAGLVSNLIQELKSWDSDSRKPQIKPKTKADEDAKGGADALRYVPINPETAAGKTVVDDQTPGRPFTDIDASVSGNDAANSTLDTKSIQNSTFREAATRRQTAESSDGHQMYIARMHETTIASLWLKLTTSIELDANEVAKIIDRTSSSKNITLIEFRRKIKLQLIQRYQAVLKLDEAIWKKLGSDPMPR